MAWETRGGQRYYYAARKVAGRTLKNYFGRGPEGELAARLDTGVRRGRDISPNQVRAEAARLSPAEVASEAAETFGELLLGASMAAAGYHRRCRGPWRKWRGGDHGDA